MTLLICDSCCGECYDSCFDRCCPSVGHRARDTLFGCIFIIIALAAVLAIAVSVAAYGIIRHPSITVENAALTKFHLSTSPTTSLDYNITLSLRVRNHNWKMAIKYTDALEAYYDFSRSRFDQTELADEGEKQPAGTSRLYNVTIHADVPLSNAGVAAFNTQRATGEFELCVTVAGEVKYTARPIKCKIEATCQLKLQLAPAPAVVFHGVKCKLAKPDKFC